MKPAEGDTNLRKVIQVGRAGHIRTTQSDADPIVLPKKLGRHTGIRAWLAHLELAYIGNYIGFFNENLFSTGQLFLFRYQFNAYRIS
jgi:hypothetical protein